MSDRAYHLLERAASLLRSAQRRAGQPLDPVHLAALAYLDRANAFSDTPQAVGDYLGLAKGNVSQRLIWLGRHGYLEKRSDPRDGRVVHLRLTAQGREAVRRLSPPPIWRQACEGSPALEQHLEDLLRALLAAGGYRTFGQCLTCRFHESRPSGAFCGLLQLALQPGQESRICREHEPPPLAATLAPAPLA